MIIILKWWSNFVIDYKIAYAWSFPIVRESFEHYTEFDAWYRIKYYDTKIADPLAILQQREIHILRKKVEY